MNWICIKRCISRQTRDRDKIFAYSYSTWWKESNDIKFLWKFICSVGDFITRPLLEIRIGSMVAWVVYCIIVLYSVSVPVLYQTFLENEHYKLHRCKFTQRIYWNWHLATGNLLADTGTGTWIFRKCGSGILRDKFLQFLLPYSL